MANTQLQDPSGKIINIGAPKYTSREARGVWAKPGSSTLLWKIYINQDPFNSAFNMITEADRQGLPVPAFAAIRGYKYRETATASWVSAYILQTATQTGTFFAMSQQGKQTVWKQWLQTLDRVRDKAVLDRALAAAQVAARIHVADPQGFLEKTRREPVVFIDIHLAKASGAADTMLQQIEEYMGLRAIAE